MTTQAVKFKDWIIPQRNRLDPYVIPFKTSQMDPFRSDGAINLYGRARKPLAPKVHTTSGHFSVGTVKRPCAEDLQTAQDEMMEALLSGPGRLWFSDPARTRPYVFAENVSPNEISWTPNEEDWTQAVVSIDWGIDNPTLYRPLSAGYIMANLGFATEVVPDGEFGEGGDERVFASWDITSSPVNITLPNIGQLRTGRIIIRLESQAVGGFENPQLTNATTNQFFVYAGTAAGATSVLQLNCGVGPARTRLSIDDGDSFVNSPNAGNVWPDISIGALQGPIMEFAPGDNLLTIESDGTPNFKLMILWLPAYAMV